MHNDRNSHLLKAEQYRSFNPVKNPEMHAP